MTPHEIGLEQNVIFFENLIIVISHAVNSKTSLLCFFLVYATNAYRWHFAGQNLILQILQL